MMTESEYGIWRSGGKKPALQKNTVFSVHNSLSDKFLRSKMKYKKIKWYSSWCKKITTDLSLPENYQFQFPWLKRLWKDCLLFCIPRFEHARICMADASNCLPKPWNMPQWKSCLTSLSMWLGGRVSYCGIQGHI